MQKQNKEKEFGRRVARPVSKKIDMNENNTQMDMSIRDWMLETITVYAKENWLKEIYEDCRAKEIDKFISCPTTFIENETIFETISEMLEWDFGREFSVEEIDTVFASLKYEFADYLLHHRNELTGE